MLKVPASVLDYEMVDCKGGGTLFPCKGGVWINEGSKMCRGEQRGKMGKGKGEGPRKRGTSNFGWNHEKQT